jgi:hypothetical protein
MKAVARRIQRLESRLTDCSGFVPQSAAWLHHWGDWIGVVVDGGKLPDGVFIPLTAIDAMMAEASAAD